MAFKDGFVTFPVLTTERLLMRQPSPDDAEAYLRGMATVDQDVWGLRGGDTVDAVRSFLTVGQKAYQNKAQIRWVIVECDGSADGNSLIGEVKLCGFEYQSKTEIAYWLSAVKRGKGYGTEAVAAVVGFAFDVLELHRVEGIARPDNAASCMLLRKLGVKPEGVLRKARNEGGRDGVWNDAAVFGMLKEEWRAV